MHNSYLVSIFFFFFFSRRRRHTRCLSDWSSDVCSSDLAVAGARGAGDDHVGVEGAQGGAVAQAVLERGPADRVQGCREWPAGEVQRPVRVVGVADGQAAELGAGSGVQQREQADEPFVRMSGIGGPSPEQRPLGAVIKDAAGEGRLAAQLEGRGRVDEDELAAFRPAKEAAQHIGPLVAVAGAVAEKSFKVIPGTSWSPAGRMSSEQPGRGGSGAWFPG